MDWGDVNARARGLATHLLERGALEALARGDLRRLSRELGARGYPLPSEGGARAAPRVIEDAIRRRMADRMAVLARWLGARLGTVRVLYEAEDRRSVRALLRGAAQKAPSAARIAGLVPTPELPAGALEELARARSAGEVLERLEKAGHPLGRLRRPDDGGMPGLMELEARLAEAFVRRSRETLPRGRNALRRHLARTVDLENAWTALVWEATAGEADPGRFFLEGGELLGREPFFAALEAEVTDRPGLLAPSFAAAPLGEAFADPAAEPGTLPTRALRARIREETVAARGEPLGPAPLVAFALRLRGEAADLRRVTWGLALGAPPEGIVADLVAAGRSREVA